MQLTTFVTQSTDMDTTNKRAAHDCTVALAATDDTAATAFAYAHYCAHRVTITRADDKTAMTSTARRRTGIWATRTADEQFDVWVDFGDDYLERTIHPAAGTLMYVCRSRSWSKGYAPVYRVLNPQHPRALWAIRQACGLAGITDEAGYASIALAVSQQFGVYAHYVDRADWYISNHLICTDAAIWDESNPAHNPPIKHTL